MPLMMLCDLSILIIYHWYKKNGSNDNAAISSDLGFGEYRI